MNVFMYPFKYVIICMCHLTAKLIKITKSVIVGGQWHGICEKNNVFLYYKHAINDAFRFIDHRKHLSRNKILGAISELEAMASAARVPWTINQRIATIKESFGYLQRYALSGVTDPSRAQQMSQISNDILSVSASILRQSQIEDSSKLYFSKLRYERLQSDSSILSLVAGYRKLYNSISMKYLGKPDADVSENETI